MPICERDTCKIHTCFYIIARLKQKFCRNFAFQQNMPKICTKSKWYVIRAPFFTAKKRDILNIPNKKLKLHQEKKTCKRQENIKINGFWCSAVLRFLGLRLFWATVQNQQKKKETREIKCYKILGWCDDDAMLMLKLTLFSMLHGFSPFLLKSISCIFAWLTWLHIYFA